MALFAITFRVHDGPRWDERYQSLTEAIESEAVGEFWEEPTSFYLLLSGKASGSLRDSILSKAEINDNDILVVINISQTKGDASHGVADVPRYRRLMNQR